MRLACLTECVFKNRQASLLSMKGIKVKELRHLVTGIRLFRSYPG